MLALSYPNCTQRKYYLQIKNYVEIVLSPNKILCGDSTIEASFFLSPIAALLQSPSIYTLCVGSDLFSISNEPEDKHSEDIHHLSITNLDIVLLKI